MLDEGNYAGVIDQLKHLDTQNVPLPSKEREDCAYLLALALYERGDADCVDLLREFAESYPASPQALPARLAAADYFFFAHHFPNALAAYEDIDYSRINPADRPLYEYRKALSMLRTGHFAEARNILETLRSVKGFDTAADYYLAYCDYVDGDFNKAYEGFADVARRLDGSMAEGMEPDYYMVQIEYQRADYQDVITDGKALLSKNPVEELIPETERVVGLSYFKTQAPACQALSAQASSQVFLPYM